MDGAIAITGAGLVCAIGNSAPEVLSSLRRKESGIGKIKYLRTSHTDIPVGEVKMSNEQMMRLLGIPEDEGPVSRTVLIGALAVREALSQAGIGDLSSKRVALISGTTVGVMDITEQYFERMKTEPDLQYLPHSNECGRSTEEIARFSGIPSARCCTICTACSSALNAIMIGADMLRGGEVDLVVAGGAEPLSRYHLNGFNSLMILDRQRCRPFDASRSGLNLGEGAGFVVLERASEKKPLAYVAGYANRCDAFHQTATSKDGEGATLAMKGALDSAGLAPSDIKYINAHGTATPDNDASESAAFRRVFGGSIPPMTSTKSYTGHTTSAAGGVETVICLLAMQNSFIPASLGWSTPFEGGVVPSEGCEGVRLDNVMCNSFGFGGNDSSLILSLNPPSPRERRLLASSRVKEVSRVTVCDDEALLRLRSFLSPMETRRMCRLMKACLLSAYEALSAAGLERPDAIITATSRGMLEFSNRFLEDMCENGEEQLKPTLFMMSTHNTIGSAIAIRTRCHGYNITYSQGDDSALWAERDARQLLRSSQARSVLVCRFDETLSDGETCEFKADTSLYTAE